MLTQAALSHKRNRKTLERRHKAAGRASNAPSAALFQKREMARLNEAAKAQQKLEAVADGLSGASKPAFENVSQEN